MGIRTWLNTFSPVAAQRGHPEPETLAQRRTPPFRMIPPFAGHVQVYTRPYSRGAAAYVPVFGVPYSNPIGSGVASTARPRASYGPAGQYVHHTIFWTHNITPISIPLGPLTSPDEINALLANAQVLGMMPTA